MSNANNNDDMVPLPGPEPEPSQPAGAGAGASKDRDQSQTRKLQRMWDAGLTDQELLEAQEPKLWHLREGEPPEWHKRLMKLIELGPGYKPIHLCNLERQRRNRQTSRNLPRNWREAVAKWEWEPRLRAYYAEQEKLKEKSRLSELEKDLEAEIAERKAQRDVRRSALRVFRSKLILGLAKLDPDAMTWRTAVDGINAFVMLNRIEYGDAAFERAGSEGLIGDLQGQADKLKEMLARASAEDMEATREEDVSNDQFLRDFAEAMGDAGFYPPELVEAMTGMQGAAGKFTLPLPPGSVGPAGTAVTGQGVPVAGGPDPLVEMVRQVPNPSQNQKRQS